MKHIDNNVENFGTTPALIVVDAQNDFMSPNGKLYCPCSSVENTETVVKNICSVVETARSSDVPIIWSKESHRVDGSDYGTERLNPDMIHHTVDGTKSESLLSELNVDENDLPPAEYIIKKSRYNCFYNTDLEHILNTFGVDSLLITGVTTGVCVHYTAHGALERDYIFRVIEECTAGKTDELHEASLLLLNNIQPDGVKPQSTIESALNAYEGNEIVKRIKNSGTVFQH